nr:hypothetical protein [Enterobacter asburiae]
MSPLHLPLSAGLSCRHGTGRHCHVTGRTESAQAQTLIITHLNDDRRVLNRMIHDEKMRNGELGEDSVTLPVLVTPDEEKYAQLRLEKQRQQQARIQNEII